MTDRDDQPDYRQPKTTRGQMPDWAKARPTPKPQGEPILTNWLKQLKAKLFGDRP